MVEGMLRIGTVHISKILRNGSVEDDPPYRCPDEPMGRNAVNRLLHPDPHRRVYADNFSVIGHNRLGRGRKRVERGILSLALIRRLRGFIGGHKIVRVNDHTLGQPGIASVGYQHGLRALFGFSEPGIREIIRTQNHILSRNRDRVAILRPEQVIGGKHQDAGLRLGLRRERNVDCHLVAVKVGVIRRANQRMQPEGAPFNKDRFKSLYAQPVQRRRPVKQNRVFFNDNIQSVPNLGALLIDHLFSGFNVVCQAFLNQLVHDKWAEQLNCHFFRHAALVYFQIRAHDNNGTPGIVHALAQQVLAETPLLALEHI